MYWNLFFNKNACNVIKKRLQLKCFFFLKFAKFLKAPFLLDISGGFLRGKARTQKL